MRNAFAAEITRLAGVDERIFLLSGDIGNRLFNDYKERYPDRFLNCGVAEANMTGVAAGLALGGYRPVTYTIAPFNTVRCLEQIKLDLCYHNLPAVVVGVGAGLSYAELGATHGACEELAALRSLPNLAILCPADPPSVVAALDAALGYEGPVYLRLGKKGEPNIHSGVPRLEVGSSTLLRQGSDACLLSCGTVLPEVLAAAERLAECGITAAVVDYPCLKPLDLDRLRECFAGFAAVFTVEEHSLVGGLGSAVAEWLADTGTRGAQLVRIGVPDAFPKEVGNQAFARERCGLTGAAIAERVRRALEA